MGKRNNADGVVGLSQVEQARTWTLRPWSASRSEPLRGLRHSIYEHDDVVPAIVYFIEICCEEHQERLHRTVPQANRL
jgi:hypothetical protein